MTNDSLSIVNSAASLPRVMGASSSVGQPGGSVPVDAPISDPASGSAEQRQTNATQGERLPPVAEQSAKQLDSAVRDIKSFVQNIQRELNFSIDEASGLTVVKIIDSQTDKVIRQIPAKEILAIAEEVRAAQEARQQPSQGVLIKEKA